LLAEAEENTRDRYLVYLARYYRGQALERKQQWAEAEAAYRGALATIPRAQSASMAFAALLSRRGARAEAAAVVSANLSAHPQPVDPVRIYGDGDDRFWPELIARLRRQIAGAEKGTEPFSTENVQKGSEPFSTDSAHLGSDPFSVVSVEKGSDPLPAPVPAMEPQQAPPVFRTASDLVTVGWGGGGGGAGERESGRGTEG